MSVFDGIFGLHERALELRQTRLELLASNIANADTPNFKAKDLDFKKAMGESLRNFDVGLDRTHSSHMNTGGNTAQHTVYRTSLNPAADGNSVDRHYEQAEFGKEAMRYTATMQFLEGRVSSVRRALRGE